MPAQSAPTLNRCNLLLSSAGTLAVGLNITVFGFAQAAGLGDAVKTIAKAHLSCRGINLHD